MNARLSCILFHDQTTERSREMTKKFLNWCITTTYQAYIVETRTTCIKLLSAASTVVAQNIESTEVQLHSKHQVP